MLRDKFGVKFGVKLGTKLKAKLRDKLGTKLRVKLRVKFGTKFGTKLGVKFGDKFLIGSPDLQLKGKEHESVIAAICPNCGYGFIFDVIQFTEVQSES